MHTCCTSYLPTFNSYILQTRKQTVGGALVYWIRSSDPGSLLIYLFSLGILILGGWFLATHVVRQPRRDRLLVGIALGLVGSIPLTALLAHWMRLELAWWAASGLVLLAGLGAGFRRKGRSWIDPGDIRAAAPSMLAWLALTLVFALINRGLAIYDDYHNLPLISTMAAGDVPPHFYLNPEFQLSYHFGLDLFAAMMVGAGGFFPWSAYDLTNALFLALTLVIVWHWVRRATGSALAGALGSAAMAFSGGVRWLLLFLPSSILARLSQRIILQGSAIPTGVDFAQALSSPWVIEGGGPVAFPFAHASGVLAPLVQSMTGSGAFPVLIPVLMLLVMRRRPTWAAIGLYAVLMAGLALTAEAVFGVLFLGGTAAALLLSLQRKEENIRWWALLLVSGGLAIFQGGVLTGLVRETLSSWAGSALSSSGYDGFGWHWPPAVLSVHFGRLSLFDPQQWLVALAELGPVILLGPWVTRCAWRRLREGDWFAGALGVGAVIAFVLPFVVHYQVERDTTRITAMALTVWLVLGLPWVWKAWDGLSAWMRSLLPFALALGALSGVTLFSIELSAVTTPQQSYFVGGMDARFSQSYWDALPAEAQVFDPQPYRAVTLFGRPVTTHQSLRQQLPQFEALLDNFTPGSAADYGFDYLYFDDTWWWRLEPFQRDEFTRVCVVLMEESIDDLGGFRRLYDVGACRTND
jgi:hypothetical protein